MFSFYIIVFYILLIIIKPTHKVALALAPWLIFACSYDWMRIIPNYEVNPIDVKGLYDTEKILFGIDFNGKRLIPNEFFALNYCGAADIMAGLFYLCWVPVPLMFGLYLYIKGERKCYLHFSFAFLLVNLIGFCIYYIYPAAPPWYAMNYGFTPILNTPGNVAGLGRFDDIIGIPVFHALYNKNANVFAAVPSLHAAYMLIATIYAIIGKQKKYIVILFAFICVGIWWTAVYSGHHYVIDVLLGIAITGLGIFMLEKLIVRIPVINTFIDKYIFAI